MALMSRDSSTDDLLLSMADRRSLTTLVMAVLVECRARYNSKILKNLADDVKIGDEMEVSHVSCKRARFL